MGELEKLRLLPAEPEADGVRVYRGGVLYTEPGVGGAVDGGRPSSLRWPAVRGISEQSSFARNNGDKFITMLNRGTARRVYVYLK